MREIRSIQHSTGLFVGLLALLGLALYWDALGYGYVWDDQTLFIEQSSLRGGWASLANVVQPILPGTTYFRPLVLATFVAEFSLTPGGPIPALSHGLNVVMHILNAVLLFALARVTAARATANAFSIERNLWVPFAAAALYLAHPALVEAVAWVSGRFDLLCTTFVLLTLLVASRDRDSPAGAVLVALLTLFAALCKEMALTLPLLVTLLRSFLSGQSLAQFARSGLAGHRWIVGGAMVGLALYFALRWSLMPSLWHSNENVLARLGGMGAHTMLVARSLALYMRLAVYPFDQLEPLHPISFESLMQPDLANALAAFALLFTVALGVVLCLPAVRSRFSLSGLATLFMLPVVSLLPVLNIIPLTISGGLGENRFLTLPLALFATAGATSMSWALARFWTGRIARLTCTTAALAVLAVNTIFVRATVPIWESNLSLFAFTFQKHPDNVDIGMRFLSVANNAYMANPAHHPALEAALQKFLDIPSLGQRMPLPAIALIATVLANLGHLDSAMAYVAPLVDPAHAHERDQFAPGMLQVHLAYVDLLQRTGRASDAGAALARAERLRPSGIKGLDASIALRQAYARQAILMGDEAALVAAVSDLRRIAGAEAVESNRELLRIFLKTVCEKLTPTPARVPTAWCVTPPSALS